MFTRNRPPAAPVAETPPAVPQAPQDAAALRAAAEEARTTAAGSRARADQLVATARSEAARLVADAEQAARTLTTEARTADREAERLDERAGYAAHADAERGQAEAAERKALDLADEATSLDEQIDTLTERLNELGIQRENCTTALTTAREAGDVAAVTALRAEVASVDEAVGVLDGQRGQAQRRRASIGDLDGAGELVDTLRCAHGHRRELERALDILDPGRIKDRQAELVERCIAVVGGRLEEGALMAALLIHQDDLAAMFPGHTDTAMAPLIQVANRPDGTAAFAVTTRSN